MSFNPVQQGVQQLSSSIKGQVGQSVPAVVVVVVVVANWGRMTRRRRAISRRFALVTMVTCSSIRVIFSGTSFSALHVIAASFCFRSVFFKITAGAISRIRTKRQRERYYLRRLKKSYDNKKIQNMLFFS